MKDLSLVTKDEPNRRAVASGGGKKNPKANHRSEIRGTEGDRSPNAYDVDYDDHDRFSGGIGEGAKERESEPSRDFLDLGGIPKTPSSPSPKFIAIVNSPPTHRSTKRRNGKNTKQVGVKRDGRCAAQVTKSGGGHSLKGSFKNDRESTSDRSVIRSQKNRTSAVTNLDGVGVSDYGPASVVNRTDTPTEKMESCLADDSGPTPFSISGPKVALPFQDYHGLAVDREVFSNSGGTVKKGNKVKLILPPNPHLSSAHKGVTDPYDRSSMDSFNQIQQFSQRSNPRYKEWPTNAPTPTATATNGPTLSYETGDLVSTGSMTNSSNAKLGSEIGEDPIRIPSPNRNARPRGSDRDKIGTTRGDDDDYHVTAGSSIDYYFPDHDTCLAEDDDDVGDDGDVNGDVRDDVVNYLRRPGAATASKSSLATEPTVQSGDGRPGLDKSLHAAYGGRGSFYDGGQMRSHHRPYRRTLPTIPRHSRDNGGGGVVGIPGTEGTAPNGNHPSASRYPSAPKWGSGYENLSSPKDLVGLDFGQGDAPYHTGASNDRHGNSSTTATENRSSGQGYRNTASHDATSFGSNGLADDSLTTCGAASEAPFTSSIASQSLTPGARTTRKELAIDDIVINTLNMTLTVPPTDSPTSSSSPSPTPTALGGGGENADDLWIMRDTLLKAQRDKKELDIIRYDIEQQRLAEKLFPKYNPSPKARPVSQRYSGPAPTTPRANGLNGGEDEDDEDAVSLVETCRLLDAPTPPTSAGSRRSANDVAGTTASANGATAPPRTAPGSCSGSARRRSMTNLFTPMSDCSDDKEWTISPISDGHVGRESRTSSRCEPPNDPGRPDSQLSSSPPTTMGETKPKVKEVAVRTPSLPPESSSDECETSSPLPSPLPFYSHLFGPPAPVYHEYAPIPPTTTATFPESRIIASLVRTQLSSSQTDRTNATLNFNLNPSVLIEGVLFRASYLGSTHIYLSQWSTKRHARTLQAKEAVTQVKASEGENQPRADVDLFISTEKIMVLNTNLQEIMMDHSLKTISYIADIGDIVVVMARRNLKVAPPPPNPTSPDDYGTCDGESAVTTRQVNRNGSEIIGCDYGASDKCNAIPRADDKMICHVFESEEAHLIAQSIGQAFQIAYMEFLKANGIEDTSLFHDMDYQDVLNAQEIFGEELALFAKKETQKEVVIPKSKGEILGIVIVESGWGSMIPTVVVANLLPGGPASRGRLINIGDQIISVNGISLVGLPIINCQNCIKATQRQTVVKLTLVRCSPVVEVRIKRPDSKFQLGFSVQNGTICSLLRGGIAERGGVRVGHRIIEINGESVVAVPHEKIVKILSTTIGEIHMKTMPTSIFRLLTGQESPSYI